jgi:hypothetical protein
MNFKKIFIVFYLPLLFASCNIINPSEPVPTYIHIDSFSFTNTEPSRVGSSSHAIGTVWVSYGGVQIGVFDLPATIPIIASGSGLLNISPGVTLNGMNDFQSVYPYYFIDTATLVANPGKIITLHPTTHYYSYLADTFSFIEDFEIGNAFDTAQSAVNNIRIIRTTSPDSVFEGKASGRIVLNSVNDTSENSFTSLNPGIALHAGASFCEFNYKGTCNLAIGIEPYLGGVAEPAARIYTYLFAPTNTWTKIYVSLSNYVSQFGGAGPYMLYFKTSLPDGQTSGYELLDNVKVVTSKN